MITKGNLLIHEFIGLNVEVVRCTDRKMNGLRGRVVDETKNTLVLESGGRERIIPKNACVFRFTLPGGEKVDVDGGLVSVDPVERAKKLAKHSKVV
jgi:ribonuclease P protein subunit POP4